MQYVMGHHRFKPQGMSLTAEGSVEAIYGKFWGTDCHYVGVHYASILSVVMELFSWDSVGFRVVFTLHSENSVDDSYHSYCNTIELLLDRDTTVTLCITIAIYRVGRSILM